MFEVALSDVPAVFAAADVGNPGLLGGARLWPEGGYRRRPYVHLDTDLATPKARALAGRYARVLAQSHSGVLTVDLTQARVIGQGAVVTRDGRLLRESVAEFVAHGRVPDGFLALAPERYVSTDPVRRSVAQPCLLAKRPWYRNFGHWLVDAATVIAANQRAIASEGFAIVIGTFESPAMRRVAYDTIARLTPLATILEQPDTEVWHFEHLRYTTPTHVPPLFKLPEAIARLREALSVPGVSRPTRRLFVTRTSRSRCLINEAEIAHVCEARGFELVDPGDLSLADQISLFAAARDIVGVKGAGLTGAMFCATPPRVLALAPGDFPDPFYWDLLAQSGAAYAEVYGSAGAAGHVGQGDFHVPVPRVLAALAALDQANGL